VFTPTTMFAPVRWDPKIQLRFLDRKRLRMSFRSVFMAVVIAFALILAAFLINRARPQVETEQPSADFVRATGKCAECHARTQFGCSRIRDEFAREERCELPRLSPARDRTRKERPSRICELNQADGRKLPKLSRTDLSAIPAQPSCRAGVGSDLRRERPYAGAGESFGDLPAGRNPQATTSLCSGRGAGGDNQRM
jgi:hypothetical protein